MEINPHFRPVLSSNRLFVYFFGIIDILTFYGGKKKLESFFKTTFIGKSVSCRPPKAYAERFKEFLSQQVFC
jgi:Phosphatidylinositol-4-phosphate 5-Kinase